MFAIQSQQNFILHFSSKALVFCLLVFIAFSPLAAFAQTTDEGGNVGGNTTNEPEVSQDETPRSQTTTSTPTPYDEFSSLSLGCDVGLNVGKTILTCSAELGLYLSSKVLVVAAQIFNVLFYYSIQIDLIKVGVEGDGFINVLWTDIRDFVNILFIIGLIYVSFALITGAEYAGLKWKDTLVKLIVVAFLLNFSLLFAKFVIDVGSVVTMPFYNAISSNATDSELASGLYQAIGVNEAARPAQDISGGIVSLFNPSQLFGRDAFNAFAETVNAENQWLQLTLLMVAFTVMAGYTAYELFRVCVFFISRIIWLVILMILSPLAMVALFLPVPKKYGFGAWLEKLIHKSFCLVPYVAGLWFLYWLLTSIGTVDNKGAFAAADIGYILAVVSIQFVFVVVILGILRKQTVKLCDGSGFTEKVIGAGLGAAASGLAVATGVGGVAARGTVGRMGYSAINNSNGKMYDRMADPNNGFRRALGTLQYGLADAAQKANFGLKENADQRIDRAADKEVKNQDRRINALVNSGIGEKEARSLVAEGGTNPFSLFVNGMLPGEKRARQRLRDSINSENKTNKKATEEVEKAQLAAAQLEAVKNARAGVSSQAAENIMEMRKAGASVGTQVSDAALQHLKDAVERSLEKIKYGDKDRGEDPNQPLRDENGKVVTELSDDRKAVADAAWRTLQQALKNAKTDKDVKSAVSAFQKVGDNALKERAEQERRVGATNLETLGDEEQQAQAFLRDTDAIEMETTLRSGGMEAESFTPETKAFEQQKSAPFKLGNTTKDQKMIQAAMTSIVNALGLATKDGKNISQMVTDKELDQNSVKNSLTSEKIDEKIKNRFAEFITKTAKSEQDVEFVTLLQDERTSITKKLDEVKEELVRIENGEAALSGKNKQDLQKERKNIDNQLAAFDQAMRSAADVVGSNTLLYKKGSTTSADYFSADSDAAKGMRG